MCKIFAFSECRQGTQPFVKLQNYKKIMTHTKIVNVLLDAVSY